jgi:RimJ/RimL family protein N-acetyltransferase
LRIIFVRHGEPDYANDCLTPEGHKQAAAAAERLSVEGVREIYATMFSMLERDTRQFIGNIEFMNRKGDEAEWGIVMTYKMQNKGYGTEALKRSVEYGFGELELRRIYLAVYADNPRAIHVYEKCGFREYDRNDVDVFMEAVREQGDFA